MVSMSAVETRAGGGGNDAVRHGSGGPRAGECGPKLGEAAVGVTLGKGLHRENGVADRCCSGGTGEKGLGLRAGGFSEHKCGFTGMGGIGRRPRETRVV